MSNISLYLKNITSEILKFSSEIDLDCIIKAGELILQQESKGKRVHLTGIGKPSYVAAYIASLLSSTGTKAYKLDATEAIHGSSGQVNQGDVVIAISNSGETKELKNAVETLIKNKAKIIAVTGNEKSWLANNSNVLLLAKADREGDLLNKPPRASILLETMILQSLSIYLQEKKNLTEEKYLQWHPGGSLGKSIKLKS